MVSQQAPVEPRSRIRDSNKNLGDRLIRLLWATRYVRTQQTGYKVPGATIHCCCMKRLEGFSLVGRNWDWASRGNFAMSLFFQGTPVTRRVSLLVDPVLRVNGVTLRTKKKERSVSTLACSKVFWNVVKEFSARVSILHSRDKDGFGNLAC